MCVCMCMCIYIYIHIYVWSGVWRSQVPPPPNGMVWYGVGGGGAGVCGEGWGPLELQLEKRPGVTNKAGINSTQALRKP